MKKTKKINLEDIPFDLPVIMVTLDDGAHAMALIDTGAETSLVHKDFAKAHKKCFHVNHTRHKIEISGTAGTKEYPFFTANVTLTSETDAKIPFTGMLFDLGEIRNRVVEKTTDSHIEFVIGSDILKTLNTKINYEKRFIQIDA